MTQAWRCSPVGLTHPTWADSVVFLPRNPPKRVAIFWSNCLGTKSPRKTRFIGQACFDRLANHLIREFAGSIRGFGRSSRSFVVKNFLALPGRIRVEETLLSVVFTSSPLNAVLHLSRLDDPVEEVAWLGGRRIEFEPYGL